MTPHPRLSGPAAASAPLCFGLCVAAALALPAAADNPVIAPEPAATGACGQPAALTHRLQRPLDAAAPAGPVPLRLDRLEPAYVEFTLSQPSQVTLETDATGWIDTMLALFDASGAVVAWDDDSAGNLHALISRRMLDAGSYCAQLRSFGWEEAATADVSLRLLAQDPGDLTADPSAPCGDPSLMASLGRFAPGAAPASGAATVGAQSRRDWSFSLAAPMTLTLEALGQDGFDPVLALHAADGRLLAENDDRPQGGVDSEIVIDLAAGDYCASVTGWGGGAGGVSFVVTEGMPTLGSRFGGAPAAPDDGPCRDAGRTDFFPASIWSGMTPVDRQGRLEHDRSHDWLMRVEEQTELQLNARSIEFDTVLELYTADGRMVAENDDAPGQGTDSEIVIPLATGDYCLRLRGFAGSGGAYQLAAVVTGTDAAPAMDSGPGAGPGEGIGAGPGAGLPPLPDPDTAITALGTVTDAAEATTSSDAPVEWFSFTLAAPGPVELRAVSLAGPFRLSLLTASGEALEQTAGDGGMDIARLRPDLPPGDYLAAIEWHGQPRFGVRQLVVMRP